ncbi:serine--tRNA ligase [Candidatus Micrarchaeota archaeon CG_4_10_14_0_2_um_filter_55_9]|nr:MAG: serine--tRNA ligase [Candidatus Micrarchaeota archaeon CG_4_10_14_0_2_um_filter_55_9]
MLSLKFVRENASAVRADLKKRGRSTGVLDELLEKDEKNRTEQRELEELRCKRNEATTKVKEAKKRGKPTKDLIQESGKINKKIKITLEEQVKMSADVQTLLKSLPNVLHESVPVGRGEEGNVVLRSWGKATKKGGKSHVDLLVERGLIDLERAAKISGARHYFLKGKLAVLSHALQRMALDFLEKKGFQPVLTPHLMNRGFYEGVTDLNDFVDVMYPTDGNQFLVATSEHPLVAMHANEVLETLPLKYAGLSACYRKEAGAHGKDQKGIFRVHQFNKVEQIVFCSADESWKRHEELIKNAEEFFQLLELPFRVVNVCTGDIGTVAAKKYDLEAWFPVQNAFREVVSCSNCTDYQANALNIRSGKYGGEKGVVHTLNCTMMADTRTIAALAENFQRDDGAIKIPKALQKYCGFKEV